MGRALKNLVFSGVLAAAGWIVGCSASTDDPQEPPPSGTLLPSTPSPSGTSDNTATSTSNATSAGGGTVQQCIAACEAKYPNGAKLGQAIDACWAKSCAACENMESGPLQTPTSGSCKNEVATPSAACSTCTAKNCCAAWDACFSNAECTALNACSIACYK